VFTAIAQELASGFPDTSQLVRVTIRLVLAAVFAGIVGYERERAGKPAGLRTHMLVALGGAVFVTASLEAGSTSADISRVIQGVATGIGFIGGGAILKSRDNDEVTGLTTAASIWLTAGVGIAAGLGRLGAAVLGIVLALAILAALRISGLESAKE